VETDASLRFGAPGIRTNLGLVRAVRDANPDAYIVYKPHPTLVAGLRLTGLQEHEARAWSNEVVTDILSRVAQTSRRGACHTSLTGFEALLREKSVVCYGQLSMPDGGSLAMSCRWPDE